MDVRSRPVGTGRWADVGESGDWTLVLRINLDSTWQLSQEIGREMVARGRGKIVNIASLLSFSGGVTVPAYTASKHAVAGLTKALANESGDIGGAVVFLASSASDYVNGHVLAVDGGWMAR